MGTIYVQGEVKQPLGNLVEVESDQKGYRQFQSITDLVTNGPGGQKPLNCHFAGKKFIIDDGTIKDTVGARLDVMAEIVKRGDVDLSTGILMRRGTVRINGKCREKHRRPLKRRHRHHRWKYR